MHRVAHAACCLIGATLILAPPRGAKADAEPLLEDPIGIIGVAPTPVGGTTLTLFGAFDRVRNGANRDTYGGGIEFEAGVAPGLDLRLLQLGAFGQAAPYPPDTGRSWGGASRAGLRWQIIEENGAIPAVGVFGALTALYGESSRPAQDFEAVALFSKTLRDGERPVALYLNAGWAERLEAQPGERAGRYQFAGGLAHSLAHDTSVALSYQQSQQNYGERDLNLVQAGIWHRLPDGGPILGFGAGAGLNRDSPTMQIAVSVKWLFGQ